MDELNYTATEARNNFFSILTALQMGKKRAIIKKDNKWNFEIKLITNTSNQKKLGWYDLYGGLSKEVANDMLKAKKKVDKLSVKSIKTW